MQTHIIPEFDLEDRLRRARKEYGRRLGRRVTQAMFAEALGTTQDRVSQWETGSDHYKPRVDELCAISDVVGISFGWLWEAILAKYPDYQMTYDEARIVAERTNEEAWGWIEDTAEEGDGEPPLNPDVNAS